MPPQSFRVSSAAVDGVKVLQGLRMNAQSARIEAGSVFLPHKAPWLDTFLQEVLAFPASRHTDQIDALSQAFNRRTLCFVVPVRGQY